MRSASPSNRVHEHLGPAVTQPARRGFGTKLIERSPAQDFGGVSIRSLPNGLAGIAQARSGEVSAPAGAMQFPHAGSLRQA